MNHNDPVEAPPEYDPTLLYGAVLGLLTVCAVIAGLALVWVPAP